MAAPPVRVRARRALTPTRSSDGARHREPRRISPPRGTHRLAVARSAMRCWLLASGPPRLCAPVCPSRLCMPGEESPASDLGVGGISTCLSVGPCMDRATVRNDWQRARWTRPSQGSAFLSLRFGRVLPDGPSFSCRAVAHGFGERWHSPALRFIHRLSHQSTPRPSVKPPSLCASCGGGVEALVRGEGRLCGGSLCKKQIVRRACRQESRCEVGSHKGRVPPLRRHNDQIPCLLSEAQRQAVW